MPDAPRSCDTHFDLIRFTYPLTHLAEALKRQRKVKIVAIGSSSTAGEGKIIPYPNRLEPLLRDQFHGTMIDCSIAGSAARRQWTNCRASSRT